MDIHRCRFVDYSPHSITSLKFSSSSNTKQPSPENTRLAVGRSNGDIEIWNPRYSWLHEKTLKGGKGRAIEGLAWSTYDNEYRLFSIGGSSHITEWDLKTGLPLLNYDCHAATIWSLAVSPDGSKLAAGCDNGTIVIVDITGGRGSIEYERRLQRQSDRILSVAWAGKEHIVGGCADARVRVWSLKPEHNNRVVGTMKVDKSKSENTLIWSVMVMNKQIVSGDSTGSVKFWDLTNYSLLQTFKVHEADVLCLASDLKGETVFSAGVDRKIVNYKIVDSKLKRWANVSNRLLHGQDVRAMAAYEAKDASFLVSGGVETTMVVNSIKDFMNGMFRKIPITRHKPCITVTPKVRYITMWEDQTVKVWRVDSYNDSDDKGRKLVLKMVLNNEENITNTEINEDGSIIAVSTLAEVKLFKLMPNNDNTLQVEKIESQLSDLGCKLLAFVGKNKLVVVTPEDEVMLYDIEQEDLSEVYEGEEVNHLSVSKDNKFLAIANYNGSIQLINFTKNTSHTFSKINAPVTTMRFTPANTLVVVTARTTVLEFNPETIQLTAWSKRNSDLLPRELLSLVDKCCGCFIDDAAPNRLWLWGANWLAFIDMGVNISVERPVKRKLDKLGIATAPEENVQVNEDDNTINESASTTDSATSDKPFWITYKYRPILYADVIGENELAVVERPLSSIPLPPAFWSTHKIRL